MTKHCVDAKWIRGGGNKHINGPEAGQEGPRCAVGKLTRISALSDIAREAVRVHFSHRTYAMHRGPQCKANELTLDGVTS